MEDDKSKPVVWLKELGLNDEQKDLIAMLINIFGDENDGHYMHPVADRNNIDNFSTTFLKEVLANPVLIEGKAKQTPEILAILESVEEKLKKYD